MYFLLKLLYLKCLHFILYKKIYITWNLEGEICNFQSFWKIYMKSLLIIIIIIIPNGSVAIWRFWFLNRLFRSCHLDKDSRLPQSTFFFCLVNVPKSFYCCSNSNQGMEPTKADWWALIYHSILIFNVWTWATI